MSRICFFDWISVGDLVDGIHNITLIKFSRQIILS